MMLILSFAVIVSTGFFTQLLMRSERTGLIEKADARLHAAAEMKREVLGTDYHDRIENNNSVSEFEFLQIVDRNDELCRRLDLQYLWSVLVLESDIVFTSATRTDLDDPESDFARFFEVHRDPDAFLPALNANPGKPVFSTFVNEWGKGRMVLIPRLDKHGRTYIFGASMQLKELEAQLKQAVTTSILIGFLAFLFVFAISLLFVKRFTRPIANLTFSAQRMASGDLDLPLKISGTKEMQSMATSFDQMRKGLKQQISKLKEANLREEQENKILTQIGKREPLQHILNQIALFGEELDPQIKVSVLLFDREKQVLLHGVAPSLPEEYNALLKKGLPIGPEVGSCGSSAYHKKLVIAEDISNDPRWLPYKEYIRLIKKYSLNACWSLPFFSSEGNLLGTIANYSNQTGPPDSNNLKVLEWSTRIAGLAVERDIAEKELISAKLVAEENIKLKNTFLQNMSHEIRTPLSGIMGFSSLLKNIKKNADNQKQIEEYIDIIQNSSKNLLAIVNDVLEISRIESGTLRLSKSVFSVKEFLEYINNIFASKVKTKGLEFILIAHDGLGRERLYADKEKLFQIIINFMNNALKFTQKGSIELFLKKENNGISINVLDTGIGIDKKFHDKVFDRFWQYEAFTKKFYGGTGLGLSISKGLADFCGYDIKFISEKDRGALFSLLLPEDVIYTEQPEQAGNQIERQEYIDRLKGLNFLIAEDDQTSLLYISDIIKDLEVGFKWVTDGRMAVDAIMTEKFDLVIMDLKMPGMDGFEAIRTIKAFDPDIPILTQSAYAAAEDEELAMNAGSDMFLQKPFEPEDFLRALEKLIRDSQTNE